MIKQGYRDYLKNIVISVGLMCLVYFYLLANFWWGNHDWGYLKDGVSVESGLFEARYSQHLFTIFFLDSHVLPVFLFFVGFLCIGLIGCLVGKYLEVDKKYWFLLAFFIGINPHIFALFYFVYLFFSFIAWSMVGVLLLFTIEGKLKWYSFCVGLLGYILVLGSYPPNLAFVFVLFVAKRLLCFEKKEESFGEICKRGVFFAGQIICAGLAYKLIYKQMINMHLINQDMYNIQLKSLREVVESLPLEVINSISQMFERFSFMGWWYVLVLFVLVAIAVVGTVGKCEQKSLAVLMILGMFLVSRFAFIVAARTDVSPFRLVYWGRLGIYVFALSFLFREKKVWVRNISFLALSVVLYCFSITDFEIQKIQKLGFDANRLYQTRLIESLEKNDKFNKKSQYISLNLGQPNFRAKYYNDEFNTSEMVGYKFTFEFDVANYLFWEDEKSPVTIGAGISGRDVLRVNKGDKKKWIDMEFWRNNPENMDNIRYWLYMIAKPYPDINSIYVDDRYLILILDKYDFYNYREIVAKGLDK